MLYHFSEDGRIDRFVPRSVQIARPRPAGHDWLNGPLVWAIEAAFSFLYLFPRDCPRILIWATEASLPEDTAAWLGSEKRVAFIEECWLDRLRAATIHRYTLPPDGFVSLDDVGMHVNRAAVTPSSIERLTNLPALLAQNQVTLRPVPSLALIKPVWNSSLHTSGIRLRNAQNG